MELVLGTAQFGMDYGITNRSGKVSLESVEKILDFAYSNNIKKIDTAISYGESEKNLGTIGVDRFNIASKIPHLKDYKYGNIEKYISSSLERLNVSSLDIVYLHDQRDIFNLEVLQELESLKAAGQVSKVGASIYANEVPASTLKWFDIVQCQGNAFDLNYFNLINGEYEIFLRSIFLQGLLLIDVEELPTFLCKEKDIFEEWDRYCKKYEKSKLEMSLYNVQDKMLDGYIIGASSVNEFEQIIFARDSVSQIQGVPLFKYESVNEYLIDPRKWDH